MWLGYETWLGYCDFVFTNRTSLKKGTHLQVYILLFIFFVYNLWNFIFHRKLLVCFRLQLFLYNLSARKLCVVSFIYFSILEISFRAFKLYYSSYLKNYGLHSDAFWRGLASCCLRLQVDICKPTRFSFSIYGDQVFVIRMHFPWIDIYISVFNLFCLLNV